MKARYALIPLGIFVALVALLAVGLTMDPRRVPSPLIGKPAPAFNLPRLHAPHLTVGTEEYRGRVWLLNVWASWCAACRVEHPVLIDLARGDGVELIGLNYKDEAGAALQWLKRLGDPYSAIAVDSDGRVGIDWGVYGVPETFVIDKRGFIRYKHIGPVDEEAVRETIVPLLRELEAEPA